MEGVSIRAVLVGGDAREREAAARACAAGGVDVVERAPSSGAIHLAFDAASVAHIRGGDGGALAWVLAVAPRTEAGACLAAGADDVGSLDDLAQRLDVLAHRVAREDRAIVAALEAFPDLIVRWTRDGRLLSVRRGSGYMPVVVDEAAVGKSIHEIFPAEAAANILGHVEQTARERRPLTFEDALVLAGQRRWYETRYFPSSADDVVVLVREVTDRRRAELKLSESEARSRAVFHSKMLGMMEWSSTGGVVDANDVLLDMIGYTREDLVAGRVSWSQMTPPEYWDREEHAAFEIANTGVCTPFEKEYVRKDGSRVPIIIGGAALDELASHGVSFVIDISDRKRVERALRESNEKNAIVARVSSDAVWDWDVPTGRVTWNQTLHTLFGYTPSEVEETLAWWSGRLHPDDRERVDTSLAAALADKSRAMWSEEYRFRTASGGYAWVVDRGWFIRDAGGIAHRGIGAMVDVTERRQMQERLLLADRLASLGTLAAGVAHEINNPLTHVVGNVELALRALQEEAGGAVDVAAALAALADARRGADRVRDIVRDLRTFARVDVARRDAVDVRVPLDWAARIAGHAIAHKARLTMHYDEGLPFVVGDESRLGQVFVNLLVNAAQAIAEGDAQKNEVRVAVSRGAAGVVVVSVADTGAGIPPDVVPHIFDPFFTTKDVGVGTGLGLSICHGIVAALGGSIEVESEVGRGTTFRVNLVEAAAGVAAPVAARTPAPVGRRGRVLVVDDDALTRTLLERALSTQHDVVAVGRADEALSLVKSGARFDIVFSDLMMPEMTGMDLHDELVRSAPELADRVVFLTAGAFTPAAQRFLEHVPNERLEKPFDVDALLELTRRRVAKNT